MPPHAGVGSAVGFLQAPVAYEVVRSRYQRLATLDVAGVDRMLAEMAAEAHAIVERGAPGRARSESRLAYMRYVGQGHEIAVALPGGRLGGELAAAIRAAFECTYQALYRRAMPRMEIEILSWAVTVSAALDWTAPLPLLAAADGGGEERRRAVFDADAGRFADIAVHRRERLPAGAAIAGPAVIGEDETSTLVAAGFTATIDGAGNILLIRRRSTGEAA